MSLAGEGLTWKLIVNILADAIGAILSYLPGIYVHVTALINSFHASSHFCHLL